VGLPAGDEARSPAQTISLAGTPYAAIAGPHDHPRLDRLEALASALDADPAAVLAFGRAEQVDEPSDPTLHPWTQPICGEAAQVDGRTLARGLLFSGTNVMGPAACVVVRCSAVDPADGLGGDLDDPGAHLRLWLELLLRGHARYDPDVAATTGCAVDEVGAWPDLVDLAVRRGLLQHAEVEAALVARLARMTSVARRRLDLGRRPGAGLATGLGPVAERLDRLATVVPDRIAVDVLVLADGDRHRARLSAEHAAVWSPRVVVADRAPATRAEDPTPSPGAVAIEWAAADWAGDDSAALLGRGTRPVLVVAAGETVDVLDAAQLAQAAASGGPGFAAEIEGPMGCEVRLVMPEPGADRKIGRPGDRRLHSVRLRVGAGRTDWLAEPPAVRPDHPRRFVIAAPGYREGSGGIVALHRLCDLLNRCGQDAALFTIDGNAATHPGWRTPMIADPGAIDGAVVVYPEIIRGNPFGARHVVRWLLNRPGYITRQPMDAAPDDLLVTWNRAIDPDAPVLALPLFDPTIFFPKDVPGAGKLLWVGKGTVPPDLPRAGMTMITRSWPSQKTELAALLRATDVLYSCDWMTALAFEALLCATPVVLVGDQRWSRDEVVRDAAFLPGIIFEDGDLDEARTAVRQTAARYADQVSAVGDEVARFVALVDRRFPHPAAQGQLDLADRCS